jgi:hypothetical protein
MVFECRKEIQRFEAGLKMLEEIQSIFCEGNLLALDLGLTLRS